MNRIIIRLFPLLLLASCSYFSTNKLNSLQHPSGKLIPIPVEKVAELENAIVVPTVAIHQQNNTTGVLVGAPNQPPKFVPITVAISNGDRAKSEALRDRTEVTSGLNGTEHILIEASKLPPHMKKQELGIKEQGTKNK